jgi:hypothetical protein
MRAEQVAASSVYAWNTVGSLIYDLRALDGFSAL